MPTSDALAAATEAEQTAYRWVRRRGLHYLDDFLFFPLLLGGIPLGYIPVNFYFRPGTATDSPLAWRIRPEPSGNERATEERLIMMQEQSSTVNLVRVHDSDVVNRLRRVLSMAIRGEEML